MYRWFVEKKSGKKEVVVEVKVDDDEKYFEENFELGSDKPTGKWVMMHCLLSNNEYSFIPDPFHLIGQKLWCWASYGMGLLNFREIYTFLFLLLLLVILVLLGIFE